MDDTRELDQIQIELDRLHERSQSNKANISAHEAVCEERYENIVTMFHRLEERIDKMEASVADIREMATQGRASLKTLLWVGGLTAGLISLLSMIIPYFR
jgi:vacuolar-type H+-ATPase subunit E/Vma4